MFLRRYAAKYSIKEASPRLIMSSSMSAQVTVGPRFLATSSSAAGTDEGHVVKKVAVYGSGLMGRGIAQVCAQAGYSVSLFDLKQSDLDVAQKAMTKSIGKILTKKHTKKPPTDGTSVEEAVLRDTGLAMSRVEMTTDATAACQDADMAIEAIVESMSIKQDLFQRLDAAAPAHCLFLSNTSSLSITKMASAVGQERQGRFAGLHFFNPVPMMRLAEVIRTPATTDATFRAVEGFARHLGKTTVACLDTPGFIVNRLLVPYLFQAIRLVENGVASKEDVDVAMKLGAGYPMGPFELADFVGLDTCKKIMDAWRVDYPDETDFRPSPMLDELVEAGKLGVKTKAGFYDYEK